MIGLARTIYYSLLLPSVALIVDIKLIGKAFGIIGICQNVIGAATPWIFGAILDAYDENGDDGYKIVSYVLFVVGIVGVVIAVIINLEDCRKLNILNRSTPVRRLTTIFEENDVSFPLQKFKT